MYTFPKAQFNFTDVSARADSRPASQQNMNFADVNQLKEGVIMKNYGTLELNQFLLDGSVDIFPENPGDIAFWSVEKSDSSGGFERNPVLEITFENPHSSVGLTLYFSGEVPEAVRIIWYTAFGTELDSAVFYPDEKEYFCEKPVANYARIQVEFISTSWPYRYVKMDMLEYGKIWKLSRENIRGASICEESDQTGATLSVNTARLEIVDENNDFDLTKQDGIWKYLQKDQSVRLMEIVDGKTVDCGIFYLDSWESQENMVTFSLKDIIGRIDKSVFYDGEIYQQAKAGRIIKAVMESCKVEDYLVEDEVAQCCLSGWLPIQSHREALQQAVFACGAAVESGRSGGIRIYRPDRHVSRTIGLERKFLGTKVTLDDYVSGVTVGYYRYDPERESSEISKGVLPKGITRIEFSEPCLPESIAVSAGRIRKACTNYVEIIMVEEAECAVTGRKYESTENAYTAAVSSIEPGETENIKSYSGCTLMDAAKAREAAQRILRFYQLRQLVELRYINDGEAAGDWCSIAQPGGLSCVTCLTGQTLDLAGGNLASAVCRGYSKAVTDYHFAGEDLYAGEPWDL